jgi:predicted alpha/beta-hydrolase family hydrolase
VTSVQGGLHPPRAEPTGEALVLTHGAGSNREAPLLVAVAEAFAARGVLVLRYNLPYRQARPSGPPRPADAAPDREGLREAVAAVQARGAGRVFLGGHSYGGRQASMLAAEDPSVAEALLLLSYPLHPPARPAAPRTGHFPGLRVPALFVHGTRDPFGSIDEVRAALTLVPAPTLLHVVEGAGHDLARRRAALAEAIAGELLALTSRGG